MTGRGRRAGDPEGADLEGAEPEGAGPIGPRVLTIPNALSGLRLACVPVIVVLVVASGPSGRFDAAVLVALVGATDWVDGYLARRLEQVTALGKVLDPLADRLLLVGAVGGGVVVGAVPLALAVLVLAREVVVATGFVVVALAGGRRTEVTRAGKAATLCLMIALPLFLVGHSSVGWDHEADILAWVFVIPGVAISWYALGAYFPPALAVLAERRVRRAVGGR